MLEMIVLVRLILLTCCAGDTGIARRLKYIFKINDSNTVANFRCAKTGNYQKKIHLRQTCQIKLFSTSYNLLGLKGPLP